MQVGTMNAWEYMAEMSVCDVKVNVKGPPA